MRNPCKSACRPAVVAAKCRSRGVSVVSRDRCQARRRDRLPAVRVYAVVNEQMSDEAIELFVDRQMAELMVENWDRDEPERAGELYVEPVEPKTSTN